MQKTPPERRYSPFRRGFCFAVNLIELRAADESKADGCSVRGTDHAAQGFGAVDNLQRACLRGTHHNPHMAQVGEKGQVSGLGLLPGHRRTAGILVPCAVADGGECVGVPCGVDRRPGHQTGAIQAEGDQGAGGVAPVGGDHSGHTPSVVPAETDRLATPEVAHLTGEGGSVFHHGLPQGG